MHDNKGLYGIYTTVDTPRSQRNSTTQECPEKVSGERNMDGKLLAQL